METIKVWNWVFVGVYERWNMEDRLAIFDNLNIVSSHMIYNPESVPRVNAIIQKLLDKELSGEITIQKLIEETKDTSLFTDKERKNTDELFNRSAFNKGTCEAIN